MSDRRPPTEPFWQFCAALNRYGVDYLIIGSEAVAFHGVPRFSVDFDVLKRNSGGFAPANPPTASLAGAPLPRSAPPTRSLLLARFMTTGSSEAR